MGCAQGVAHFTIHIGENIRESEFADLFSVDIVIRTSRKLAKYYEGIAGACGCEYMDAAVVAAPSPVVALHLDTVGHGLLGKAIAKYARIILE